MAVSAETTTAPTACIGNGTIVMTMTGATALITAPIIGRRSVRAAAGTSSGKNRPLGEQEVLRYGAQYGTFRAALKFSLIFSLMTINLGIVRFGT